MRKLFLFCLLSILALPGLAVLSDYGEKQVIQSAPNLTEADWEQLRSLLRNTDLSELKLTLTSEELNEIQAFIDGGSFGCVGCKVLIQLLGPLAPTICGSGAFRLVVNTLCIKLGFGSRCESVLGASCMLILPLLAQGESPLEICQALSICPFDEQPNN